MRNAMCALLYFFSPFSRQYSRPLKRDGGEKTGIGKGRGWMKNNNQKRREEGERGVRGEKDRNGERGMREERKERGATEKWGARKAGGGESRGERQKRKGMEGWVKGEQPGIVQPRAQASGRRGC